MKFRLRLYIISVLLVWLVGSCTTSTSQPTEIPPTVASPSPTGMDESTPVSISPNPTDTPELPPLGILLVSPNAEPVLVEELRLLASAWAEDTGLRFQVREALSENDFAADDIRWVVAIAPAVDLADLALNAPETRFLAVGGSGLEASSNLSVILSEAANASQQGFMAGYIAALITPDWRVGVVSLAENEAGAAARDGFIAGAIYFCGLCRQESPPYFDYPLFVELTAEASSSQWQSAANILLTKGVETIYIVPGAGDEALLQYLAQSDVELIGDWTELPDAVAEHWVVSLRFDTLQTIQEHWSDFVSGVDGVSIQVPLTLSDPNPELLSPGRQHLAEKILEDVLAGYIESR